MARLTPPLRLALAALLLLALPAPALAAEPPAWGLPALQPGDAWTYAVAALDGSRPAPPDAPFEGWVLAGLRLTFLGPGAMLDGVGQPVAVTRLAEEALYTSPDGDDSALVRHVHHAAAGRPVGRTWTGLEGGAGAGFGLVLPDGTVVSQFEEEVIFGERTDYRGPAALCGQENGLQGGSLPRSRPFEARGACGGGTFRFLGETELDGRPTWVAGQADAPRETQLWLQPATPAPVRVIAPAPWNASLPLSYDLTEFAAGDGEAGDTALPQPAPPVAWAARRPWGPDEAGVAHPFPLSEAHRAALADAGVAAFLDGHPDAYLQSASFHELRYELAAHRELQRTWTLQFADAREAHRVVVRHVWQALQGPAGETEVPAPPREEVSEAAPDDGPFPPAAALPARMPTVASLLARWEAYREDDRPANGWGFSLPCGDPDCVGADLRAWAGRDLRRRPTAEAGLVIAQTDMRDASLTAVDGAGATVEHLETRPVASSEVHVGDLAAGSSRTRPEAFAAPAAAAPAWPLVAGAAAASLAALAGLALWAAAKGGGIALWHRPAAEHPARTALLQLVEAEPGLHHQEILRRLGRGNHVVTHHLRVLEREGRLVARQGGRYRCYFLAGAVDRRVMAAAPVLKTPLAQRILAELAAAPATGQDLAARLGAAPSSVAFHVKRFQEAGLVTASRDGRAVRLSATPAGQASVAA